MYKGQYQQALNEFQNAVRRFRIAEIEEELANTYDNMGRVYALLGREFQATQLIKNGLEIRKKLGLTYREALSANSQAMVLIRFGHTERALISVENALNPLPSLRVARGIGLGLLSRGSIYRNKAEMWREMDVPIETALRTIDDAETDLKDAVRIFSTAVNEPIREVQAYNEMACSYRARYLLELYGNTTEQERTLTLAAGSTYFRKAMKITKQYRYTIEELDSLQDHRTSGSGKAVRRSRTILGGCTPKDSQ